MLAVHTTAYVVLLASTLTEHHRAGADVRVGLACGPLARLSSLTGAWPKFSSASAVIEPM